MQNESDGKKKGRSMGLKMRHVGDEERDAGLKPGRYKGKAGGLKTRRYEGANEGWTQRADEERRNKGRPASFGLQTQRMIAWIQITVKL